MTCFSFFFLYMNKSVMIFNFSNENNSTLKTIGHRNMSKWVFHLVHTNTSLDMEVRMELPDNWGSQVRCRRNSYWLFARKWRTDQLHIHTQQHRLVWNNNFKVLFYKNIFQYLRSMLYLRCVKATLESFIFVYTIFFLMLAFNLDNGFFCVQL